MSFVMPIRARATVTRETLTEEGGREGVEDALRLKLKLHAHGLGYMEFNDVAVLFQWGEPDSLGTTVCVTWCPPPDWASELELGPLDGEVRHIQGPRVTMAIEPAFPEASLMGSDSSLPVLSSIEKIEYMIAGINPVSNCWVYQPTAIVLSRLGKA